MECIDFEARLQDALDQRCQPETDAALLEHIHGCPACRGLAQSLGLVLDVVAGLPTPSVPADLSRRVLTELVRPNVVRLPPQRRWLALSAAAAVVAALSIPLGYWFGRQNASPRELQPLAAGRLPASAGSPATDGSSPQGVPETEQRLADAFWNAPFVAAGQAAATDSETRWGQDVQTSLEPLTRSTAAALDSLWQAIPAAAEDSRS